MKKYYKLSSTQLDWLKYKKSKLLITHFYRINVYINKHHDEVLHVKYRGKHFNIISKSERHSDKAYNKKADFIKSEITNLLNNLYSINLSFQDLQFLELNPIEVAITNLGNDAVMVIIEQNEIGLLVFKDNYQNSELILKKFKEGFYNTILNNYLNYSSFFGVYKV